mmetsp:Transcript_27870/g.64752  ORF Transcript_27870/g.64752 Transcript_27870/m.64752 type:complete len:197 (+) Transcript_27870:84-674(+)|eukprot:CAMPEP_0178402294 /NCGR_PEP_ID=MMETSP0689_2-20121128/16761_1 /TAXON_ID=160604 /ORGANISM="Amphidinium massartii, Strain CS-259" /LENGTH=196 /DNA_ID=CAMNT_0020023177 /DNA_START=83 /DNA_END=673 /DNA_ORIENTATION=+
MARTRTLRPLSTAVLALGAVVLLSVVSPLSLFAGAPRPSPAQAGRSSPASSRVVMYGAPKEGIFSPVVRLVRKVIGPERFQKVKGKAIQAHSNVIAQFVDTSESPFGKLALRKLFEAADADKSGQLDKEEIRAALKKLGFEWMDDDKKVEGVIKKGDKDGDELIDLEEFAEAAPTILRQNLIKLAKANGSELGFLS